jgi:hypothetical protein
MSMRATPLPGAPAQVLNVGLDLGVLSDVVFSIFVFMALATTFLTVPAMQVSSPGRTRG